MMRKIHRVALAAHLKSAVQALDPVHALASTAWARVLGAERRFTFFAPWKAGYGFVIFEPSATALDDYFTVDLAWIRGAATMDPKTIGDDLTIPHIVPWRDCTQDEVFARERFRLRIDDLWKSSPREYRGSFTFSTAASRYVQNMASIHGLAGKAAEDRAFEQLQHCMAEEKALSDAQALAEVTPAANLALRAITEAALPAFRSANALAGGAD